MDPYGSAQQVHDITPASATEAGTQSRSIGRTILALVFAILALNALVEAVAVALRIADEPATLGVLQGVVAVAGGAAAWGSWRAARWAPVAAIGYGVLTAIMVTALGPLLELDRAARRGLWAGAAVMLGFSLWAAWYLRRAARRAA